MGSEERDIERPPVERFLPEIRASSGPADVAGRACRHGEVGESFTAFVRDLEAGISGDVASPVAEMQKRDPGLRDGVDELAPAECPRRGKKFG